MNRNSHLVFIPGSAALLLCCFLAPGSAATLNQPVIRTVPTTVTFTNWFFEDNFVSYPSDNFQITVNTTIGSTIGIGGLIGSSLSFDYYVANTGNIDNPTFILSMASIEIPITAGFINPQQFYAEFPTGDDYFDILPPFAAFSAAIPPNPDDVGPAPWLIYSLLTSDPLPTKTLYEYRDADGNVIDLLSEPDVTEIGGVPVFLGDTFTFVEGTLDNVVFQLSTVYGPPVPRAAIPLPAALPLALAGFGLLALLGRRPRRPSA